MHTVRLELFRSSDNADAFALRVATDPNGEWRAQRGFGATYTHAWSVDVESAKSPELEHVDWDAVLERVVDAATLSDPVVTGFHWPQQESAEH